MAAPGGAKRRKKREKTKKPRSQKARRYDAILSDLAVRMLYGVRDDQLSIEELEEKLAHGKLIEVQCSNQSRLAARAIERADGRARMVGSFINPFVDGPNTGHVMMEVRVAGKWYCYDIMSNVQAIGDDGHGCSLEAWCASPEPRWRRIASDPNHPQEDDLAAIYDRLLGTPWVAVGESPLKAIFYDPDPENAAHIMRNYPWLHAVSEKAWKQAMS